MAPKILRKQVNNDVLKETLFNKKNTYGPNTMAGLALLVGRREINLTDLDSLSPDEVKRVSKELQLSKIYRKTNVMLLEEIKYVAKMYIAGQGKKLFYFREDIILNPNLKIYKILLTSFRPLPHIRPTEGENRRMDGSVVQT